MEQRMREMDTNEASWGSEFTKRPGEMVVAQVSWLRSLACLIHYLRHLRAPPRASQSSDPYAIPRRVSLGTALSASPIIMNRLISSILRRESATCPTPRYGIAQASNTPYIWSRNLTCHR
jgi:hypothetical protein